MNTVDEREPRVVLETTSQAVRLARTLTRSARFGALAVLDPETGAPLASRVGVATDVDGAPILLVSLLAAHARALGADARCCLLVGEPGKGDPMAHPRISIRCRAKRLEPGSLAQARASGRYLARNPKAELYADLGDFFFVRLEPEGASLNGGFGRAFELGDGDLLLKGDVVADLAGIEASALEHMNDDHSDAVGLIARVLAKGRNGPWRLTGIDAEGLDLALGDEVGRLFFASPLLAARDLRQTLADLTARARQLS